MHWLEVTIISSIDQEEIWTNLLFDTGTEGIEIESSGEREVCIKGYFPADKERGEIRHAVDMLWSSLNVMGNAYPKPLMDFRTIHSEEYLKPYREALKPLRVDNRLIVVTEEQVLYEDFPGHILRIRPGQAFGTGHHFTTLFCLKAIMDWGTDARTMYDVGCGSGILSILGEKVGIREVYALDYDPHAMENATINIFLNKSHRCTLLRGDIFTPPFKAPSDLVVANLDSETILKAHNTLMDIVGHGGRLVISGVSCQRSEEVLGCFQEEMDIISLQYDNEREWAGAVLEKRSAQ